MKNRIAQLINSEGLTSSKFADTINVQRSSISHILSGRNNPSLDFIHKIMNAFPSINLEWLMSGKGEMYKNTSASLFDQPEAIGLSNHPPKIEKESQSISSVPESVMEMNSLNSDKQIEKVVVFYTDKTFKEYNPA